MSSELAERLPVNTIWSVLRSDVSWGTKGDNKVSTDLGVVKANKGERTRSRWPCRRPRRTSTLHMRTRYTCCRPSHRKRIKRWTQQPHRKTFTGTSGQSAQRFSPLSCRDWYFFLPFLRSVLMSWVLSNVGDFSAFHFVKDGLWMCASLFRRCWSPLFCKLLSSFPLSARAHSVRSTTNGSAKTSGADHTVNGYLISILYSVAVLACASPFSLSQKLSLMPAPLLQLFAL